MSPEGITIMDASRSEVEHAAVAVPRTRSAGTPAVRASDADREHFARILRAAAGEGLLTLDEADERLAAAYAARFRDELDPLTVDLPYGGQRLLENTPEARVAARMGLIRHAFTVAVVAAALITAWALSGADFFWPAWPLAFMAFSVFAHARRLGWHHRR
ncbi:MAG: DUF1707 domain-containing protein [Actinomycetota bacterium]|nr:DUF1707 domain-containing protein [Actinomycetota bacterium]